MAVSSRSVQLRQEGNKFYTSASTDLSPVIRQGRLEKALLHYNQSLGCAFDDNERCSALKNIGMANWKLANLSAERSENVLHQQFFFKEAIKHLSKSHNLGRACKPPEWSGSTVQSFYQCVQDALTGVDKLAFLQKAPILEQYVYLIDVDSIRADYCVELAQLYFHEAVVKLQEGNVRQCLSHLKECYRPVEEARKAGGQRSEHVTSEVNVLEADCFLQTCIAESVQARSIGDNLLDNVLNMQECLNMDMVWDVVDWYKQAIILTRENDVEMEAIALSRLGRVYDKILKMKSKASECFKRAIQLAMSLHPRTFDSEEWFRECRDTLKRYQIETVEQEDKKWQEQRAKYIAELKEELREMEEANKNSSEVFVAFVYQKFPPKNPAHKLENDLPAPKSPDFHSKMKTVYKNAVCHYHPDRQNENEHGKKWKVLCEEITKLLTTRYERFK